jgi:hypothetical protein
MKPMHSVVCIREGNESVIIKRGKTSEPSTKPQSIQGEQKNETKRYNLPHGQRTGFTSHPTAEWMTRQLLQAFPWDSAPRFPVSDRDGNYGKVFSRNRRTALGIQELLCAPALIWSDPWPALIF